MTAKTVDGKAAEGKEAVPAPFTVKDGKLNMTLGEGPRGMTVILVRK